MGWLRSVGALKLQVSFAKEPYKRDYILQKRPMILRSLLIEATPYRAAIWKQYPTHVSDIHHVTRKYVTSHVSTNICHVTRKCHHDNHTYKPLVNRTAIWTIACHERTSYRTQIRHVTCVHGHTSHANVITTMHLSGCHLENSIQKTPILNLSCSSLTNTLAADGSKQKTEHHGPRLPPALRRGPSTWSLDMPHLQTRYVYMYM